ncbi:MAG TPA: hypothetical protein VL400_05525, partial [Polyangiaceae bacterium]|nr:hypothetical protein [Polyangiaceae bacterium]
MRPTTSKRTRSRAGVAASCALVALVAALATGCAYRVPEPALADALPSVTDADLRAASITVQDDAGMLDADGAAELRGETQRMLGVAMAPRSARVSAPA